MATRKRDNTKGYDFYSQYDANIAKIMRARDLFSDRHRISLEEAKTEWVDKQLSDDRKQAAQDLLINTHYITFNMMFSSLRDMIPKLYIPLRQKVETGQLAVISLYAGEPNTDTYFMAVIVIYFIRLLGYPDPSIIYHTSRLGAIPNEAIIYINDISYHGKEIAELSILINKQNRNTDFVVGLVVITEVALKYIQKLSVTLYYNIYIPCLKTVLNKSRFLKVCYFFAPSSKGAAQVSIYFDHSVGSLSYSFVKTLMLGPIPPTILQYLPFDDCNMYTLIPGIVDCEVYSSTSKSSCEEKESMDNFDKEFKTYIPMIEEIATQDNKLQQSGDIIKAVNFYPLMANYYLPLLKGYSDWNYFDIMAGYFTDKSSHTKDDEDKMKLLTRNIRPFYKNVAYTLT